MYSDGAMGLCGAETTFDLLRRYEPFGGETVKIRAVYDLRRVGSASPDGREAVIDSAPVVLGWTLHPLKNQSLTVTENGTYIPNAGYTGFDSVTVNVAGGQESEAKEKRYVFENEHVEPFRGDTDSPERYTVSGNVTGLAAGTMLYVECNGQPYGYFTLDAQSIEEMGSGYCDIEFLPNLYYGVDFDAMGSAGWHWAGEEAVQLSLYYLRAAEVDTGGAACLHSANGYTVFLDGNHSLVRIHNPEAEGKLLVIRDSYSNSLGCFLAESYSEVVLVDLRYYKQPVSALAAQEGFDDILICYSIGNFLTDNNLIFLR